MPSIFTKIINREIPAHIVAEDEQHIAFLDIMPLVKGHVLVVPKEEVDYIYDLDDELYASLHLFAKKVAKAQESVIKCTRIGVAVIGLEVPHVHIHLVPLRSMDDINFSRPKLQLEPSEMEEIASKIKLAFDQGN
ncbi:HIT family protein [Cyclobacterium marinum]|uniref:Histidine triad (HIT) protein n=1 Tax=Cyclobacterium marinum (strain ATCC 25205 / DSM 745 / LMG 13164 / NCIMB 1802) TaxID=880070 RepID=G0IVM5_CYCMS|nr:HIT family protein [Cyclobacterium marinum]AEL24792.1 histidine triad (HIT) protein [Cyclobacterium marinum DSM 745]MBR9774708.1 HIT family protein [Cytophagales bacterium]|tara:strand:+ start:42942 stop:43346 length:405 start_codon:yes stop_codon:yes gene_type:complete